MPRVLIAGCGYVGAATAELLHQAGWDVEGWTGSEASAAKLADAAFPVRAVDLTNAAAIDEAASDFEVIIQSASSRGGGPDAYRRIYLEAAHKLSAAFPHAKLLFTSSTSVYAQKNGEWVTELDPAEPERVTARILREAEEFVLAQGGAVARLAGIYGPGRSALLQKLLSGTAEIGPNDDRFLNQIHRDDAAAALALLGTRLLTRVGVAETDGPQIFNVSDHHPISRRECLDWLAEHFGRPVAQGSATPEVRKRGDSNKRVSSAKLQTLGWSPTYPTFEAGMVQVIPTLVL